MTAVHVTKEGTNHGPFTIQEINTKLASGELSINDNAWFEGSSGWQELSSSQFVELAFSLLRRHLLQARVDRRLLCRLKSLPRHLSRLQTRLQMKMG